jgi:hypothetical protein
MKNKNEVKVGDRIRITEVNNVSLTDLTKDRIYEVVEVSGDLDPIVISDTGDRYDTVLSRWEFVEEEMVWISRDLVDDRRIDFHEKKPDAYYNEESVCWKHGRTTIETDSTFLAFLKHIPEPGQALGIGKESGEILEEIWLDVAKKESCQPKEIIVDGVKYRRVEE